MANPGFGYRTACDVLMEMSYHLIEPVVKTVITAIASQTASQPGFALVVTLQDGRWLYPGALLVLGFGDDNAEVVAVQAINPDGSVAFTTAQAHTVGESVFSATFPSQQATDPLFTQAEMLGYLARAQNEFLAQCPVYYGLTETALAQGQVYQALPPQTIELNRVAVAKYAAPLASLTRVSGVVTAITQAPHGLDVGSTLTVRSSAAFSGAFQVTGVSGPNSLTYAQAGADGAAQGGMLLYFSRLYETTQAELNMMDRTWRGDSTAPPTAFYQDRTGLYRWGVNTTPSAAFPVELLTSQRDVDVLGLLDGFLVPDSILHFIKYRALAYVFSKDGVQADPSRAEYCNQRFQRGAVAVNRYLTGFNMNPRGGE